MVKLRCFALLAPVGVCATAAVDAPPAIMDSTPAGSADIRQAVAAALGKNILTADDALTNSSVLIIERRVPRTMQDRVGNGRILDAPETFLLVLDGGKCVLVHRRTGDRYTLENARCHAAPARTDTAPSSKQSR